MEKAHKAKTWRAALTAILILLPTIGAVAIASPAQALPKGCVISTGYIVDGGHNVGGYYWWLGCQIGGDIPQPVTIYRFVSPVQWTAVASGTGDVFRPCNGNALNQYKVNNNGTPFWYACG